MITKKQAAAKPQPTERLVAMASFAYNGKALKKGDPFIAEVRFGRVLRAARRAMFDPAHAQGAMPAVAPTEATKERASAVATLAKREKARSKQSDAPTVSTVVADASEASAKAASEESVSSVPSDVANAPSTYVGSISDSGSSSSDGGSASGGGSD